MMDDEHLTEEVVHLIAKHSSSENVQLSDDTRLGEDLRIVGDDADDFLADFASAFNVDMSGMVFEDYFPSEASADMHYYLLEIAERKYTNPLARLLRFLEAKFWSFLSKRRSYKTITLGDLVMVAKTRCWKL